MYPLQVGGLTAANKIIVVKTVTVKVYQINLHKCKGAQANLINQLGPEVMKDSIFLIQEPHWHKNSPTSLSRSKFQVFNGSGLHYKEWPRAIVIATKDLKISGIESLSSRDMTVVTLNLQGKEVLVCSSYHHCAWNGQ